MAADKLRHAHHGMTTGSSVHMEASRSLPDRDLAKQGASALQVCQLLEAWTALCQHLTLGLGLHKRKAKGPQHSILGSPLGDFPKIMVSCRMLQKKPQDPPIMQNTLYTLSCIADSEEAKTP